MKYRNKFIAFAAATMLAITGHPAAADDHFSYRDVKVMYPDVPVIEVKTSKALINAHIEEMLVTAQDLSEAVKPKVQVFNLRVGLNNKVLVHVYDKKTDTWKFVGTDPSVAYDG